MKSLVLILSLIFTSSLMGQSSYFVSAKDYYAAGYYEEAIESYKKELKRCQKKGNCDFVNTQIAMSFYKLHDYKESKLFFDKVVSRQSWTKNNYLYSILTLKSLGLNKEASVLFKESEIKESQFKKEWLEALDNKPNTNYHLFNSNIAVGNHFTGITKWDKGYITSVVSSSKREKTEKYLFFNLEKENDSLFFLKDEFNLPESYKTFYQGNPMSTKDKDLFFVQNKSNGFLYSNKNKSKKNLSINGENLLNIFLFKKNENIIDDLLQLNGEECNNVTPFFTELNGLKVLLFASDRNSEKHNYNLYYSVLNENNKFEEPKLIKGVNTSLEEVFPSCHDGTLFFSSRGYNSNGGLDVFKADLVIKDNSLSVSNIENIGAPINSSFDDFGMYWDSDSTGFIGSNLEGENGEDRVYRFNFSDKVNLKGVVVDQRKNPIEANVLIETKNSEGVWVRHDSLAIDNNGQFSYTASKQEDYRFTYSARGLDTTILYFKNSELIDESKEIENFKTIMLGDVTIYGHLKDAITEKPLSGSVVKIYEIVNGERILVGQEIADENGDWDFDFQRDKDYEVEIELRNYERIILEISNEHDPRQFDFDKLTNISLSPEVKKDEIIRIDNIYFEYNSAEITEASLPILENLIKFLNNKPNLKIELSAHTDCVGSDRYNNRLSQKRAESCYEFLIDRNINKKRLIPVGYGEKHILNGCFEPEQCSEEENSINRRIEVKVL